MTSLSSASPPRIRDCTGTASSTSVLDSQRKSLESPKAQLGPLRRSPPHSGAFNFARVIDLFTGRHTFDLFDRQAAALTKLCATHAGGFFIRDLEPLARIVELCDKAVSTYPQCFEIFVKPLCSFLALFCTPLLPEKASDILRYEEHYHVLYHALANYLTLSARVPETESFPSSLQTSQKGLPTSSGVAVARGPLVNKLQIIASDALYALLLTSEPRAHFQPSTVKSGIVSVIVKAFAHHASQLLSPASSSNELLLAMIALLLDLSYEHVDCIYQMCDADIISPLCLILQHSDVRTKLCFDCVELLWNVLEMAPDLKRTLNLSVLLPALRITFEHLLTQGASQRDREVRNELVILVWLLQDQAATERYHEALLESGWVSLLLLLATHIELGLADILVAQLTPTMPEDFELKKLVLNTLFPLISHAQVRKVMIEGRFLDMLQVYLTIRPQHHIVSTWAPHQIAELRRSALAHLAVLAPLEPKEFSRSGGCKAAVSFLIEHPDLPLKASALTLLLRVASACGEELSLTGLVRYLLSVLRDHPDYPDQLLASCLSLVGTLCAEYSSAHATFVEDSGLDLLIRYIRQYNPCDPNRKDEVAVAAIDCVRQSIVTPARVSPEEDPLMQRFLAEEGVFLLLDLVETASSVVKYPVLSCLVDMTECTGLGRRVIELIKRWKSGKTYVSTLKMLLAIWAQEELRHGAVDHHGVLIDPEHPLERALKPHERLRLATQCDEGPYQRLTLSRNIIAAVKSRDLREKIYALFCKIGTASTKEELTYTEHIRLLYIERYLDFRIGDLWRTVSEELERESVEPILQDKEKIDIAIERSVKIAKEIQARQRELVKAQTEKEIAEEHHQYQLLRGLHEGAVQSPLSSQDNLFAVSPKPVLSRSAAAGVGVLSQSNLV